jgi:hypothetical protein
MQSSAQQASRARAGEAPGGYRPTGGRATPLSLVSLYYSGSSYSCRIFLLSLHSSLCSSEGKREVQGTGTISDVCVVS